MPEQLSRDRLDFRPVAVDQRQRLRPEVVKAQSGAAQVSFGVRQIDVAIVDDPTCQRVLGGRASQAVDRGLRSVCWTSGGLMPKWLPGMENGWAPGQLDAVTADPGHFPTAKEACGNERGKRQI